MAFFHLRAVAPLSLALPTVMAYRAFSGSRQTFFPNKGARGGGGFQEQGTLFPPGIQAMIICLTVL